MSNGLVVGRRVGMGVDPETPTNIEIVGVVRDAKYDKNCVAIRRPKCLFHSAPEP